MSFPTAAVSLYCRFRGKTCASCPGSAQVAKEHLAGTLGGRRGARGGTMTPGGGEAGAILSKRGDAPYRFSYEDSNDLLVLKVPKTLLAGYVPEPDRHCAKVFDGRSGMGGLFSSTARCVSLRASPPPAASA